MAAGKGVQHRSRGRQSIVRRRASTGTTAHKHNPNDPLLIERYEHIMRRPASQEITNFKTILILVRLTILTSWV